MSDSEVRLEFVGRLGEEFVERFRRGDRPALSEYTDRYPDYADDIRDLFPTLVMLEQLAPQDREHLEQGKARQVPSPVPGLERLSDLHVIREVGRGGMGIVYEAEQISLGRRVALKVLPQQMLLEAKHRRRFEREAKAAARLHHTNIVPVFGVGEEAGIHYYVMQFIQGLGLDEVIAELQRLQTHQPSGATKPPTGEVRVSKRQDNIAADVARSLMSGQFAQTVLWNDDSSSELDGAVTTPYAQDTSAGNPSTSASGRLSDSFELGSSSASSIPFPTGSDKSTSRRPYTFWHSVANIGRQVADALQYAHEQGVLHRDIKPSNLLLDLRGTVWVTDFGLAKAGDQEEITHTGDVLGTLRYMSPEAFNGTSDARSEVYSLGLTLYELLALRPAFEEKDRHRLIKLVTTGEPKHLDEVNPNVPRDLSTIVHKAIDRDPAKRYSTAGELAADLQRFLDDEPIRARRITPTERFLRWTQHNKGLAAALIGLAALLILVAAGSALSAARFQSLAEERQSLLTSATELSQNLETALDAETKASQEAVDAKDQMQQVLVEMSVERGFLAAERGQYADAVLWFAHAAQRTPAESQAGRDNIVRVAQYFDHVMRPVRMFQHPFEWVEEMSFDPSGRYLLSCSVSRGASQPAICRLWDIDRSEPLVLPEFSGLLTAVAWSDAGRLAALGTSGGEVLVWDLQERCVIQTVQVDDVVEDLSFSADGAMLGIAAGSTARVWDVASDIVVFAPQAHPDRVRSITVSDDGTRLATLCEGDQLRIFACRSDSDVMLLPPMPCRISGRADGWEPHSRARALFVDEGNGVLFLGIDGPRILNLESRECLALEDSALGYCLSLGETPAFCAYGWGESELQTFLDDESRARTTLEHQSSQPIYSAAFTPDGAELLTAGGDRRLNFWNVATGSPGEISLEDSTAVSAVCVSAEERRFATAQRGGLIVVWERPSMTDGSLDNSSIEGMDGGTLVCVSRDGKFCAPTGRTSRGARSGTTEVFDIQTRLPIGKPITVPGILRDAHFSHDGDYLLTLSSDRARTPRDTVSASLSGQLQVWHWQSGELAAEAVLEHEPRSLDVSPDGEVVAVLCVDGIVRVFDCQTTSELHQWQAVEPFRANNWYVYNGALRFAPQGRLLLTWNTDQFVRAWDADNGDLKYSIDHRGLTRDIAFSADGRLLATSSDQSGEFAVIVSDLETGRPLAAPLPHPDWAFGLAFHPHGELLVTACRDSTARVWDWRNGTLFLPPMKHEHEVQACSFSPDGRFVVTAGEDDCLRIWSALDGKPVAPPQPLSGSGWMIAWSGHWAIVTGYSPTMTLLNLEKLDRWTDRSVADVVRFSELIAGRRVEAGGESPLTADEWFDRYRLTRDVLADAFALEFGPMTETRSMTEAVPTLSVWGSLARHWRRVSMAGSSDALSRALQYYAQGNWPWAARGFLAIVHVNPVIAPRLAAILVDNGLLEDYRRLCEFLLDESASTTLPYFAAERLEMYLLVPDPVPEDQLLRQLADLALTPAQEAHPSISKSYMARGLMALRYEEFDAAIEWSRRSREGFDETQVVGYVPSLIVEGLAQRRLGHDSEATELFTRAVSLLAALQENGPVGADRLVCRILLREAELEPDEPADAEGLKMRGQIHLLLGHFSSAAEYFRRSLALDPDNQLLALHVATLLIAVEDTDALADLLHMILERWGDTGDPTVAERTAKAVLLSPNPGPELERACELADYAVAQGAGHQYEEFFWHAKALAEYRRGNYAQALSWSQRINNSNDSLYRPLTIASKFLTAMSEHRLGNSEAARLQLNAARVDFDVPVGSSSFLTSALWSEDEIWCYILEREATALIEGITETTGRLRNEQ